MIMLALSVEGEPNQSGTVSLSRRERHQRSGNQRGLEFAAHILNGRGNCTDKISRELPKCSIVSLAEY